MVEQRCQRVMQTISNAQSILTLHASALTKTYSGYNIMYLLIFFVHLFTDDVAVRELEYSLKNVFMLVHNSNQTDLCEKLHSTFKTLQ